jgi:hypothetical protein
MFNVGTLDWMGIFGGLTSFLVIVYVQRYQRIIKSRGTQLSTIAFAVLVAYIWAPIGFPNSEWARAPLGTDVVRLIPFIQFDPALLKTAWLPMQILIGGATYFLAALALYGDARRALIAVIGIMAFGLEISQAATNVLSGPIPPFRVDIHDILTRGLGAFFAFLLMKGVSTVWRWRIGVRSRQYGILGFIDSVARRI